MKQIVLRLLICSALCCSAASLKANVLLDDHFLVSRTNQNLPTSSRWFTQTSQGAILTNMSVGTMTGIPPNASSTEWLTYFMPENSPSALNVGDTLKITMTFSNNGVTFNSANAGVRMGLFNYSAGGTRITADGVNDSAAGANVQGYGVFMNFSQTNGFPQPLKTFKRTGTTAATLLGSTSGIWDPIYSNSVTPGDIAYSNNVIYTMVFSVTLTNTDALVITNLFIGPDVTNELVSFDWRGGAYTNFDCFAMRPQSAVAFTTNFIFLSFKVEGPPAAATKPSITSNPQDMTLAVSDFGIFSFAASGTGPLTNQWYFNNTSTPLANETNQNLLLTNVQMSQAGQYFAIVRNGQGSATSQVATLTVTTPVHTPRGVIVDDTFQNNSRVVAVTPTTSDWVCSVDSQLYQNSVPGPLVAAAQANTSTLWVGNFVDPGATDPLDIDVGDALRVTMVFTPTNVAPLNTGTLRFGIFDFYDGSRVLAQDGNLDTPSWNGSGGGTNARGYMVTCNFGTNFGDGTPLGFYVRNNLSSLALMNSTGDFVSMGSGPSGMSNAPAFLSGSEYTMQMTAARVAPTSVQLSARITGPQLNNFGFLAYDNTYFTHRFSGFGLRSNRTNDSADFITISHFKVEVIAATNNPVPPFSITSFGKTNPTNFFLNWQSVAGTFYQVQSTTNLLAGTNSLVPWVTNTALAASGTTATWTNLNINGTNDFSPEHIFYRVVAPSQP